MKPITQEWIKKAEGDYATLMRAFRARKNPNHGIACFYARQCAQRYFKSRLQEADSAVVKVSNLKKLFDEALQLEPNWTSLQNSSAFLTIFDDKYLYPGTEAAETDSKEAVKHCRLIRKTVRQSFGLSTTD